MSYLGSNPNLGTAKKLDGLTFNGVDTSFAITVYGVPITVPLAEQLIISINGVVQEPNTAYSVLGGNLIFSTAPAAIDTFFGVVFGFTFSIANVVMKTGDTMAGDLVLYSSTPPTPLSAASKGYVDTKASLSGATFTGDVFVPNLNFTGYIAKTSGSAPTYLMFQDGTGRMHWYWNTIGGTSPVYSVSGEDASDLLMTVSNSGSGGSFTHRTASGVGKVAGDPITWINTIYADLNTFSYKGQDIWHNGNLVKDTAWNSYGAGTVPIRHPSGYLASNFFYTPADTWNTSAPSHVAAQWSSDSYIRWQTWTNFTANIWAGPQLTGAVKVATPDFRLKAGTSAAGYGLIFRNDGANFYMLTTALNDANGAWNAYRPFTINLSNGDLTLNSPYLNTPILNGMASFYGYLNYTATAGCLPASTSIANGSAGVLITSQGNAGTAGASYISLHRPNAYAAHFGIDTDNKWKVGGWSMGTVSYEIFHAGNTKTINGQSILGSGNISTGGYTPVEISSNTTATAGGCYVFLASLTLTLPASPSVGNTVTFSNMSGTSTSVIARNGSLIMGLAENMTVNANFACASLVYTGATKGWVIIA